MVITGVSCSAGFCAAAGISLTATVVSASGFSTGTAGGVQNRAGLYKRTEVRTKRSDLCFLQQFDLIGAMLSCVKADQRRRSTLQAVFRTDTGDILCVLIVHLPARITAVRIEPQG